MSYAINVTTKIMSNALEHFAQKHGKTPTDMQLNIFTDNEDCIPKYRLLMEYAPIASKVDGISSSEVTFVQILDKKRDMFGKEQIVNEFLPNAIKRLASELNCDPREVNILIFTKNNETAYPLIMLWKGTEQVRQLYLERDIFVPPQQAVAAG